MSEIIASSYELIEEIGSGGGGIVYLAKHLRLDKKVVLKADKRKITTNPELLRREVDILKDLTHSYIPKVFDFFFENETVYTVMDYIEGESLDKVLKRGEKLPQSLVIEWGRQLLEALDYLHTPTHGTPPRGFVHSDIKPANLMRTPFNKICLIDFNIALALGEENVIGCSAGYASPEHYGLDYSNVTEHTGDTTVLLSPTELFDSVSVSASVSSQKKIIPDVRSDIYSAGATLYHLFSGRRPAREAVDVTPLTHDEVSPRISEIIAKAMNPNPDLRYQTAAEMLYAFNHLHEDDVRTKNYKKSNLVSAITFGTLFSIGLFSTFTGLKRIQTTESWLKNAEYATNAIEAGDRYKGIDYALEAFPDERTLFTPNYVPEAITALTSAVGVYDLSDGFKSERIIELPSSPIMVRLSQSGKTCAALYSGNLIIFDTESGKEIVTLKTDLSALSEVEYIDEDMLIYAGNDGITAYNVEKNSIIWKGNPATGISVSEDGKSVAAIYKSDKKAYIYDASNGTLINTVNFGEKSQGTISNDLFHNNNYNVFSINSDGSRLAVSFSDGSLDIFNLKDKDNNLEVYDNSFNFVRYVGDFSGDYFAFSASTEAGDSNVGIVDCINGKMGGFSYDDVCSVACGDGQIYLQADNMLVSLDPLTLEQVALVNMNEDILEFDVGREYTLVSTENNFMFFDKNAILLSSFKESEKPDFLELSGETAVVGNRNSNTLRILGLRDNSKADILSYDTNYFHDETRISADERYVMMFTYLGFRIYDRSGSIICDVEFPDSDLIYDQQYRREGGESYLEVFYIDGRVYKYSGTNGKLIGEENVGSPDYSLNENFLTDEYRIESPLHGTPKVYRRDNGEFIKELESDAYLTYIVEYEEYIIAQYIVTDGSFCGVLMNDKLETLAVLPYFCDILNGKLIFDYPMGIIRESRIYTINELTELARKIKMEDETK